MSSKALHYIPILKKKYSRTQPVFLLTRHAEMQGKQGKLCLSTSEHISHFLQVQSQALIRKQKTDSLKEGGIKITHSF